MPCLSMYILNLFLAAWRGHVLLFLAPILALSGYVAEKKIGAAMTNLFHHKDVASLMLGAVFLASNVIVQSE